MRRTIDLDDEERLASPPKIRLDVSASDADSNVYVRERESSSEHEIVESVLRVAARASAPGPNEVERRCKHPAAVAKAQSLGAVLERFVGRETESLRLMDGVGDLKWRVCVAHLGRRTNDRGERDAKMDANVTWIGMTREANGGVDQASVALRARDFNTGFASFVHTPQSRGTRARRERDGSGREHRSHHARVPAAECVADRIDTRLNTVEAPTTNAVADRRCGQSKRPKLTVCHVATLRRRDRGDSFVDAGGGVHRSTVPRRLRREVRQMQRIAHAGVTLS